MQHEFGAASLPVGLAAIAIKSSVSGDRPSDAWRFSIRSGEKVANYKFKFVRHPESASEVYCSGLFKNKCDIPLQYESIGLLYWGGKSAKLPVKQFPEQPVGFPVRAGA